MVKVHKSCGSIVEKEKIGIVESWNYYCFDCARIVLSNEIEEKEEKDIF